MNLMENLNSILWVLFGVLSLVQVVIRWGLPAFRKNPDNAGTVETIDSFWIAMAVALSLKAVLVQPFTIPSGSMEDTLLVGDYILVKKFEYGYSFLNKTPRFLEFKKPQRQEILVFVFPGDHTKDFIKRCVGIPGDVIEYKEKTLYVNGVKQVEPYVKHIDPYLHSRSEFSDGIQDGSRDNFGPVTVEAGHYFMMGDNRDNSMDSRYWGQLDEKLIKGRAWVIYWHSVGFAHFIALLALAVALVSILLLLLTWARTRIRPQPQAAAAPVPANPAAKTYNPETAGDGGSSLRSHIYTIVIACVLAGVLVASTGLPAFKDSWKILKDRVFTVIR